MKTLISIVCRMLLILPLIALAQSESQVIEELKKLAWQNGPTVGRVGDKGTVDVPKGFLFLDAQNTRRFLELNGNPPRDGHYLLAPNTLAWFSVFSFNPSGYVKDTEKIDADDLLKSLKEGDVSGNKKRKELGMTALYTDGWEVRPYYDSISKHLEWGVRLRSETGEYIVNYTSRLLGRTGVMSAVLVSAPQNLAKDAQSFKSLLTKFDYVPGEKYSDFKQGDKVAEYGLAALILGGAAAVATKKGFWAVIAGFFGAFWKIIVGVVVAILASLGKLFKRKE